jgi:hypothetical protein
MRLMLVLPPGPKPCLVTAMTLESGSDCTTTEPSKPGPPKPIVNSVADEADAVAAMQANDATGMTAATAARRNLFIY